MAPVSNGEPEIGDSPSETTLFQRLQADPIVAFALSIIFWVQSATL
ncbi:hypothetical protein [Arthrobacter sp. ISL-5]|nr:hypothetical protein [Arthrobacter sp. ISL-5]MBT2553553.1 hypothetical protein [Arthrobacter sp. ISL-5]